MSAPVDMGPRSSAELASLQLKRLRWSIRHAYTNVARFRTACEARGVVPDDLSSLADLARFPFTTKADLRAGYPFGLFAVPREQVLRIHASSGTTGQPTVVGYTQKDVATWSMLVARSIYAAGGRPGMRVHVAYGYGLFTGGLGAHYGAEALGCTVIPMSGGQTEKQVRLITDLEPDIIMVTPSYMLALIDESRRHGIDLRRSSLRYGIFGAEPWTDAMREEIERASGLKAADIYGLSEVMGPGVAQEFEGECGPTIWEDHFLPEVVDPETGDVLPDGEEGELVLTSLTKQALPVIRYRTRDLTRLLPGARSPMRRMARITGRTDDMLIVRGVNLFPTQIEELILRYPRLSPHFELHLSRPGRLDELRIIVEARPGVPAEDCKSDAADLLRRAKELIGLTADVRVVEPDSLARSGGKAVRVVRAA